jgi:hypothetical protein
MLYPLGMGLVKISCLTLYLRLFSSSRFRIVVYCSMAFVTAMSIATIFSVIFQCLPIESNWVLAEWGTRTCINRVNQQYATSALAFLTDIGILFLPMKYLLRMFQALLAEHRKLTPPRTPCINTRKNPSHLFNAVRQLVGYARRNLAEVTNAVHRTCIASIIRFKWIHFMQNSTDATCTPSSRTPLISNFTNTLPGDGFYLSVWTSIEFHFAVITTSIPAIKPLYVGLVSKVLDQKDDTQLHSDPSKEAPMFFLPESRGPAIV